MKTGPSILLAADCYGSKLSLSRELKKHGLKVTLAEDYIEAGLLSSSEIFDICLVDIELTVSDAFLIIKEEKKYTSAPIIVIVNHYDYTRIGMLYQMGVSEVLKKPFLLCELLHKIKKLLELKDTENNTITAYKNKDIFIDFKKRRVFLGGRDIKCTITGYNILTLLARNAGHVIDKRTILKAVFQVEYASIDDFRVIRTHMTYIRRALNEKAELPRYILTKVGKGYYMPENELTDRNNECTA